jgi:hypothetical protein
MRVRTVAEELKTVFTSMGGSRLELWSMDESLNLKNCISEDTIIFYCVKLLCQKKNNDINFGKYGLKPLPAAAVIGVI